MQSFPYIICKTKKRLFYFLNPKKKKRSTSWYWHEDNRTTDEITKTATAHDKSTEETPEAPHTAVQ
jgi:hypothetical protein